MTTDQQVAKIIMSQIGNRAFYMIGADSFVCGDMNGGPALRFKIKASRTHKYCTVTLKGNDTYTVRFQNVKGTVIAEESGIYANMLNTLIAETTGLALSL